MDPLFGEGIYYAVLSGHMVARAILAGNQLRAESLVAYEAALEREILPDFRATGRIARVVYAFPRLAFKLLRRYQEVVQAYFRVLQGTRPPHSFCRGEAAVEGVRQRPSA